MARFYLVRHGETNYELADKRQLIGGAREFVPLTALGRDQIERLALELRDVDAQLIIASPVTRALQSAAILSRLLDLPISVEFDLHEWVPDLTYRYASEEEIFAAYDDMKSHGGEWPAGKERNWEPMSSVRRRASHTLERYAHLERIVVVCHAVVIDSLIRQTLDVGTYRIYQSPAATAP